MAKASGTVRQQILDYLTTYGEVSDATGRSTAVLTEALGLPANRVGTVSAMLTALAGEGLIERELEHRRCYAIRLAGRLVDIEPTLGQEVDYDLLAKALLQQTFAAMAEVERLSEELERIRETNGRLKRQLESADKRAVATLLRGSQQ